ncbi:hypothetical protein VTO42DRAFT_4529 [Malbranchea cinnamomea]
MMITMWGGRRGGVNRRGARAARIEKRIIAPTIVVDQTSIQPSVSCGYLSSGDKQLVGLFLVPHKQGGLGEQRAFSRGCSTGRLGERCPHRTLSLGQCQGNTAKGFERPNARWTESVDGLGGKEFAESVVNRGVEGQSLTPAQPRSPDSAKTPCCTRANRPHVPK